MNFNIPYGKILRPLGVSTFSNSLDLDVTSSLAKISFIIADAPYKNPSDSIFEVNAVVRGQLSNTEFVFLLNNRIIKIFDKLVIDGLLHFDDDSCLNNCMDLIQSLVSAMRFGLVIPINVRVQVMETLINSLISKSVMDRGVQVLHEETVICESTNNLILTNLEKKFITTIEFIIQEGDIRSEIFGSLYHLIIQFSQSQSIQETLYLLVKLGFEKLLDTVSRNTEDKCENQDSGTDDEEELNQLLILSQLCVDRFKQVGIMQEEKIALISRYLEKLMILYNKEYVSYNSNLFELDTFSVKSIPYKTVKPLKLKSGLKVVPSSTVIKTPVKSADVSIKRSNYKYHIRAARNITPPYWMNLFDSTRTSCYNKMVSIASGKLTIRTSDRDDTSETEYGELQTAANSPALEIEIIPASLDNDQESYISKLNKVTSKLFKKRELKARLEGKEDSTKIIILEPDSEGNKRYKTYSSYNTWNSKIQEKRVCWKCIIWPWHFYNHPEPIQGR